MRERPGEDHRRADARVGAARVPSQARSRDTAVGMAGRRDRRRQRERGERSGPRAPIQHHVGDEGEVARLLDLVAPDGRSGPRRARQGQLGVGDHEALRREVVEESRVGGVGQREAVGEHDQREVSRQARRVGRLVGAGGPGHRVADGQGQGSIR